MSRKPRSKPKSPSEIAAQRAAQRRQDFEAVGLQPDASQLLANAAVEIRREGQRNAETARRADAFDALKAGMAPGCYDAARRLERDFRIRLGEADNGPLAVRVDNGNDTAGRMDRMLAARDRIDAVLERLSPRDRYLLTELISPSREYPCWRDIVAFVTEERHAHGQGAAVRAACLNLRDAYEPRRNTTSCVAA